jgi:Cys-rich four helix bundle protein (predicted Tat secretion target)
MERRDFIEQSALAAGAGLLSFAGWTGASNAYAAETQPSPSLVFDKPEVIQKLSDYAAVTSRCAGKGYACMQHCDEELAAGQTGFAKCSAAVRQMVVLCQAMTQLASMKSVRVREVLDACIASCEACRDACNEHKAHWAHGMHLECKACSEACDETIAASKALRKVLGA